ncbi:glutaconyl-CoA decarboxylase [Selenomonas ruminantium]|uniref:Glutaconyl-CoA decarboxylase n=1 Tax=Selenomonas ruminantium TaxID=971 RepID=A0A1M6UF54_SELRU|nr:OadG family protein [Selenomonas ruminantium]SHK67820.1 glutaconyl-CoA decarboxylase [Selenomonas ruminantium]
MSHPVTTNPLIIMLINMTVVFLVLIALGVVINLIHYIDPTKPKAAPQEEAAPAVAEPVADPEPVVAAAPVEEGISPEVVAVIAAAVASMGYGAGSVRAIRPLERNNWKNSGRNALQSRG